MPRVRGTLPLGVALVAAASIVALLAFSSTLNPLDAIRGRGAVVEVPDVEGSALPRAEAEIVDAGLEPVVEVAFSLSVPRGSVIRQDPAPSRRAREGDTVELVVSQGANRVAMPDAVGRPLSEVTPELTDAAVPFEVVQVAHEQVAEGVVLSQTPDPGVTVTGEDTPRFEVSSGPARRAVPAVAGMTLDAAAFMLGEAGFGVGEVRFVDDAEVPIGAVAGTDPTIGTMAERDLEVGLLVSAGRPPTEVPGLVGTTRAAAIERLESLGFLVTTAGRLVGPEGEDAGQVLDQSPSPGTPLRPGQRVTIVVGRVPPAAPPTTTTTTTVVPPSTPGDVPASGTPQGGQPGGQPGARPGGQPGGRR